MPDKSEYVDPEAMVRLSIIRLFLANRFEDCEIVKCLDSKTGETCDVLFIPAMDPKDGDIYMTPTFAIPESEMSAQEERFIPLSTLPKTSPADFKNN